MTQRYPAVFFRTREAGLTASLMERGASMSEVARRDLRRYYALLRQCLPKFTEREALLLADAFEHIHLDEHTYHLLWAEVDRAIRRTDKRRPDRLSRRLRGLHPAEVLAVIDALERARRAPDDRVQNLRAVGLIP